MMNQGVNTVIKPDNNTIICKAVGPVKIKSDRWTEFGYLSTIVDGDYTKIVFESTITRIPDNGLKGIGSIIEIYIPDSVTSIGFGAFGENPSLTSITIPNSVTSIGQGVFYGCSGLTSITIPDSVSSFAKSFFEKCTSLTTITIPNSVKSIGDYAFYDCSSLTYITYNGTKSEWGMISKGNNWKLNVPATIVHCTDGDVEL